MEKWILLSDFLADKSKYNKLTKLFIDYNPDKKIVHLSKKETGCKEDQTATTELSLGWHAIKYKRTCYLISHQATKFQLCLYGDIGHHFGCKLINNYSKLLYSSKDLKSVGTSLTESFYKELPKHIKILDSKRPYWIPEISLDFDDENYYEIKTIWEGFIHPWMLYCSSGNEYEGCFPLRPCVKLPFNTYVNVGDTYYNGKTPERALKIKI